MAPKVSDEVVPAQKHEWTEREKRRVKFTGTTMLECLDAMHKWEHENQELFNKQIYGPHFVSYGQSWTCSISFEHW